MRKPKLYTPRERTRTEIEELLSSPVPTVVCRAIIDAATYEEDWRWLQERCIDLLQNSRDTTVRMGAIHGIQFLAAVRGQLDPATAVPALVEARTVPDLTGQADEALDDIFHRFPSYGPGTSI